MKPILRTSLFVVALGAVGVIASARPADAQSSRFPESSTSYRKRMDNVVKVMREACNAHCPAASRSSVMASIDKMASRIMEVCADGIVTSAENDYVASTPRPAPVPTH